MKLLKIIAIVVGTLVLVLMIGGVLLVLFFDPNAYKPQIEQAVQQRTGRELTIEGDLGLSVFPWLGIESGPARLSNAEGFDDEPFAQVRAVNVRVKLLPLIAERSVEADTVTLDGLRLHLARDAAGRGNWEDLLGPPEEVTDEVPPEERAPAVAALAVNGLNVTDAHITWDDRISDHHLVISDFDLRSGSIALGQPVAVESSFAIENRQPQMAGRMDLQGNLIVDVDAQRYAFQDGTLNLDLGGEGLPEAGLKATVALSGEADLARQVAEIPQFTASLAGMRLDARLHGEGIVDRPSFTGSVQVAEFNPRDLMARLGMEVPATADPQVLSTASLSTALQAQAQAVNLEALEIRLDDTVLTGTLGVQDFANPAVRFELAANAIDLDRYRPPPAEDNGPGAPGDEAPPVPVGLPVDTLRGLNLKGRLNVGQLKINNLTTTEVLAQMDAQGGLVRIDPLRADLYQGQVDAKVNIDVRGEEPRLQVEQRLNGIQAEPLLRDLIDRDLLSGTGEFATTLSARGATPEALGRSLDGNATFRFSDGAIKGINIARLIREARARLAGEPLPESDVANETDFTELEGTATISGGVISNRDLTIKSPLLRITGEGTVDLPGEQIDYRIRTVIVSTVEGQHGKGLEELRGVPIPIRVSGSLTEPRFAPDLEAVVTEHVKERVQERVEERVEELREQVEDRVKEQLRGLFR